MRRAGPVLFVVALALTFPLVDGCFTDGASYVHVLEGRVAVSVGVEEDEEGIMFGMYRPEALFAFGGIAKFEQSIGKRMDSISFYPTWGDREENVFPTALMGEVDKHGAIALPTWEAGTTEFIVNKGRSGDALRTDFGGVADGRYDEYIRERAKETVVFGKLFFLRYAHEMNNPQYPWSVLPGNTSGQFSAAWRHGWTIFREEGARKVIWVWSPKHEAPRSLCLGGKYVDWIGTGVFKYGSHIDAWYTVEYLFESVYRSVILYDKAVMLAEPGCSAVGRSKPVWYTDLWCKLRSLFPAIRAVVLYNEPTDRTLSDLEMYWAVDEDDVKLATVADAVNTGVFRK